MNECKGDKNPSGICLVGTYFCGLGGVIEFVDDSEFELYSNKESFESFPYCPYCGEKNRNITTF